MKGNKVKSQDHVPAVTEKNVWCKPCKNEVRSYSKYVAISILFFMIGCKSQEGTIKPNNLPNPDPKPNSEQNRMEIELVKYSENNYVKVFITNRENRDVVIYPKALVTFQSPGSDKWIIVSEGDAGLKERQPHINEVLFLPSGSSLSFYTPLERGFAAQRGSLKVRIKDVDGSRGSSPIEMILWEEIRRREAKVIKFQKSLEIK